MRMPGRSQGRTAYAVRARGDCPLFQVAMTAIRLNPAAVRGGEFAPFCHTISRNLRCDSTLSGVAQGDDKWQLEGPVLLR
jgi:hypothetical protein